ncbi:MAG: transposase [Ignavibacteria bacterium]|nr:transposase [Ignavibacteria bacterium]
MEKIGISGVTKRSEVTPDNAKKLSGIFISLDTKIMEKKMPNKKPRSAEEKLSIVLEGIKGEISISEICRKYGLSQSVYYKWRDKFFEGGKKALTNSSDSLTPRTDQAKIEELEKVIGRQTVVIEVLKKNLKMS